MKKLRITLTDEETQILTYTAEKFGYSLQRYVKFVLAQEIAKYLNKKQKEEYIKDQKQAFAEEDNTEFLRSFRRKNNLSIRSDELQE